VTFTAIIDCPSGHWFEGQWHVDLIDVEQMDAAPEAEQFCPECECTFWAVYPGWVTFGEAG
jgi:hypothetical protein